MNVDPRALALIVRRGPLAMQGEEAARGLKLWARLDGIDLRLVDDPSPDTVTGMYHQWLRDEQIHLVLGPYGSGLVRRTLATVPAEANVLWNHGGSADDLARPGAVQIAAPASSYLVGAVRLCARRRIERVVIVTGKGPFSAFVAKGARDEARRLGIRATLVFGTDRLGPPDPESAVLITAGFQEDVATVERIRSGSRVQPALLGCVAAGVPQFGHRLGTLTDGVIGPTQWSPTADPPDIGPSGARFARLYEDAYGQPPGYVAAQAAAAGFLAAAAHRKAMNRADILAWRTSTLLGNFALDQDWRQVGHTVTTTQWSDSHMTAVPAASPVPSGDY